MFYPRYIYAYDFQRYDQLITMKWIFYTFNILEFGAVTHLSAGYASLIKFVLKVFGWKVLFLLPNYFCRFCDIICEAWINKEVKGQVRKQNRKYNFTQILILLLLQSPNEGSFVHNHFTDLRKSPSEKSVE